MATRYRIVFLGLTETEPQFMLGMSSQFGVSQSTIRHILEKAPVVLKQHLTLGEARDYAEALQRVGGKVHIQEYGESGERERERVCGEIKSFGDFTVCPECGFTQLKAERCVKCGFFLSPEEKKSKSWGRDRSC